MGAVSARRSSTPCSRGRARRPRSKSSGARSRRPVARKVKAVRRGLWVPALILRKPIHAGPGALPPGLEPARAPSGCRIRSRSAVGGTGRVDEPLSALGAERLRSMDCPGAAFAVALRRADIDPQVHRLRAKGQCRDCAEAACWVDEAPVRRAVSRVPAGPADHHLGRGRTKRPRPKGELNAVVGRQAENPFDVRDVWIELVVESVTPFGPEAVVPQAGRDDSESLEEQGRSLCELTEHRGPPLSPWTALMSASRAWTQLRPTRYRRRNAGNRPITPGVPHMPTRVDQRSAFLHRIPLRRHETHPVARFVADFPGVFVREIET